MNKILQITMFSLSCAIYISPTSENVFRAHSDICADYCRKYIKTQT